MRQVISFNNKNWALPAKDYSQYPLGLKVYDGDVEIYYKKPSYDQLTLYYAINQISNWTELSFTNYISDTLTIHDGETVYFYGPITNRPGGEAQEGFHILSGNGKIDLIGNILSLTTPDWTLNTPVDKTYTTSGGMNGRSKFNSVFKGLGSNLYNAKDSIIRTNYINCADHNGYSIAFGSLFDSCSHLLSAPQWICEGGTLSITGIANFIGMFNGCSSLTLVILPPVTSSTNASRAWESMFNNCSSLNKMTYSGTMSISGTNFSNGVSSTGDFYNLNGATYSTGTSGIPSGWTVHNNI